MNKTDTEFTFAFPDHTYSLKRFYIGSLTNKKCSHKDDNNSSFKQLLIDELTSCLSGSKITHGFVLLLRTNLLVNKLTRDDQKCVCLKFQLSYQCKLLHLQHPTGHRQTD